MPNATGSWVTLRQDVFEETHPVAGGFIHFREAPAVRAAIEAMAQQHGWPLIGIFISGSGSVPSFALNRSDFPTISTGSPNQKADQLQNELDAQLAAVYEGGPLGRYFFAKVHIWNYRNDKLYTQRVYPDGDIALYLDDNNPPGNWWQRRGLNSARL